MNLSMNLKSVQGAFLAASVACAFAGGAFAGEGKAEGKSGTVQCKEANSCKGQGSCAGMHAGDKHGCKGQNSCAGNLREVTKDECKKLGGTVVASK
jgi:hypothetical protein